MIADETVGITEEEILPFLRKKGIRRFPWLRSSGNGLHLVRRIIGSCATAIDRRIGLNLLF